MANEKHKTAEKEANHLDGDKQLANGQGINSDEDIHEAEAGNVGEADAEKDLLSGPQNDLVGMPADEDRDV